METNSPIHNAINTINQEIEKIINNKEKKNIIPNWFDEGKISISEVK